MSSINNRMWQYYIYCASSAGGANITRLLLHLFQSSKMNCQSSQIVKFCFICFRVFQNHCILFNSKLVCSPMCIFHFGFRTGMALWGWTERFQLSTVVVVASIQLFLAALVSVQHNQSSLSSTPSPSRPFALYFRYPFFYGAQTCKLFFPINALIKDNKIQ